MTGLSWCPRCQEYTQGLGDHRPLMLEITCQKCGTLLSREVYPPKRKEAYMRKVLICGDRDWTNRESIRSWLSKLQDWGFDTVIEGEARGADTIAREEAELMGFAVLKFPANWTKYGRAAGQIRNGQMLDEKPELVVAFHGNIQASKGTANTLKEAERRGIQTILVED